MRLVQRGNRQLRVADGCLENMLSAGYVEVDQKTGKPLTPVPAAKDINTLKKENDALRKENKELKAQVEALSPKQ